MNLVIDVGNSFIKVAVFQGTQLVSIEFCKEENFNTCISHCFNAHPDIERAIISSVGRLDAKRLKALKVFCPVHELSHESKIPFRNRYATPRTLGMDRIALVSSAFYHYPHTNCLVIDAGTCITYDFINAESEYLGGAISPGLQMRFRALHEFTSRLPLVEETDYEDLIGISTDSSIITGVIGGAAKEIDGIIAEYLQNFKDLTVILTGGDHLILSKRIKNTIFAHSNFLLEGLNYLLELNKH
ncbi:type III pantothenate kinase [Robertkochia aurantiaca]|uniref:type III pantothenate kinase n=1 Tax=Robertkochia aurantiaca TaxID=2873700 RepID=UPI001CC992A3|nr:type III pantothenate kinase [Robertkochia sp. 3YJGBD-33]